MAKANEQDSATKTEVHHGERRPERLDEQALDAFWEVVATRFPEITCGDLSPLATLALSEAATAAVTEWIDNNVPKICKSCGSEIVRTINDSVFGEGECGPCEYQRYKSHPGLLAACILAEEEIGLWRSGGFEDPLTTRSFESLQSAISKAHD